MGNMMMAVFTRPIFSFLNQQMFLDFPFCGLAVVLCTPLLIFLLLHVLLMFVEKDFDNISRGDTRNGAGKKCIKVRVSTCCVFVLVPNLLLKPVVGVY